MCPLCLTTAAVLLAGTGAAGGLAVRMLRKRSSGQRDKSKHNQAKYNQELS